MRPVVRWATPADLDQYYATHPWQGPRSTVTAMVGELDGEIIAVGGVAHVSGHQVAFYDMDEKARPFKVTLVRSAKRMIEHASKTGAVIFAGADPKEPGAKRWIISLGFEEESTGIFRYRGA